MIEIYGSVRSSAGRCIWCLEEVGVPYQNIAVDMKNKEHKSADFLKMNPNGKVPVLKDENFFLFESMAINLYLAEKYRPSFLGRSSEEKALTYQWSFWAQSDLQDPLIQIFIQKVFISEEKRDQKIITENLEKLPRLFQILDKVLLEKKYLTGSEFSVADLNVCSVVQIAGAVGFEISSFSHVDKWVRAISDRAAYKKFLLLRS